MLKFKGFEDFKTKEEMLGFLDLCQNFPHIAIDSEKDPDLDHFICFSIAYKRFACHFPVSYICEEPEINIDEEVYEKSIKTMSEHPLRVFQHAGHDIPEMENALGCDFSGRFADTMIMAHMINEELYSKDLDSLYKHFVDPEGGKKRDPLMQYIIDHKGWSQVPAQLMGTYCDNDAIITSELFIVLEPLYIEQFGPMFS